MSRLRDYYSLSELLSLWRIQIDEMKELIDTRRLIPEIRPEGKSHLDWSVSKEEVLRCQAEYIPEMYHIKQSIDSQLDPRRYLDLHREDIPKTLKATINHWLSIISNESSNKTRYQAKVDKLKDQLAEDIGVLYAEHVCYVLSSSNRQGNPKKKNKLPRK